MRIEQVFLIGCAPQVAFDYVTNPENLSNWQTSLTAVEQVTAALLGPLARRGLARQFARYHENLRRNLERAT